MMKWTSTVLVITAMACMATSQASAAHGSKPSTVVAAPAIHIEDVQSFYKVYDAARGHPTASQLQHDYLDPGSPGLHRLAELRHVTGASMAKAMAAQPGIYVDAKRCMSVLPAARVRLQAALGKLAQLYPQMTLAPVTVAVGRGKPVGVTDASGVMIGLEALCSINYFEPDVEDRFVHVLAHEYAHVQQATQSPALFNDAKPTVLEESLIEGAAEFVGELISGSVANVRLAAMTKGHEKDIETAFVADEDSTDLSKWLYNGTLTKPGDLGYRVGYRIAKSYYQHATDKRRALREILEMTDPKAFLSRSGWHPGIELQ